MSEADIPDRFGPAARWTIASIVLFVLILGISDSFREAKLVAAGVYTALFIITFIIAVKWKAFLERRRLMAFIFIAVGAACLAIGIGLLAYPSLKEAPESVEAQTAATATLLRLQFYGDARVPAEVGDKANIHYWYAQFSPSIGMRFLDKDGNVITPPGGSPSYGPTWNVFVVLEKPVRRRQIVASFSNPEQMGPSEIVGETDRSFIFHSFKEMPAGVLELRAIQ
jgi:hypothetical protein